MGSTTVQSPTPPPAPTPVDPGQSAIDYIQSMSNPELQQQLLTSEQTFRPQYNELNLQDLNQYLLGTGGAPGALSQFNTASLAAQNTQSAANTMQRQADINDVSNLGAQATQAFQNANPQLQAQMQAAQGLSSSGDPYAALQAAINGNQQQAPIGRGLLGQNLYDQAMAANGLGQVGQTLQGRAQQLAQSTGAMTPDELRAMQQDVRGAYAARGTEMGNGAISAEALGRLTNERQNMMNDLAMASGLNQAGQAEIGANRAFQGGVYAGDLGLQQGNRDYANQFGQQNIANQGLLGQARGNQLAQDRAYALQLAQMQAAIASDPFQAILGRSSGALQYGAGQQGFAGNLTGSMQGAQLFDPNAGINLALQNNANMTGYNSAVYGAQAGLAGANASAAGAAKGGMFAGGGAAIGAAGGIAAAAII